jgi:flagellar biosynthesis protein FlhF
MKIKKYVSSDMRQAMRAIREEQGPDAVILSNRTLPDGVEITVAIDYEADAWASSPERSCVGRPARCRASREPKRRRAGLPRAARTTGSRHRQQRRSAAPMHGRQCRTAHAEANAGDTAGCARVERPHASFSPIATELLRELTEIGFARDVAARVADALPTGIDFMSARRLAIARLADELTTTGDRWLDYGGTVCVRRADRCREEHCNREACCALGHAPWAKGPGLDRRGFSPRGCG